MVRRHFSIPSAVPAIGLANPDRTPTPGRQPDAPPRWRLWQPSTITRFALVVFFAFAGGTGLLLAFLARSTQLQLDLEARRYITAESATIADIFTAAGPAATRAFIGSEMIHARGMVIRLEAPPTVKVAAAGNLDRWPAGLQVDRRLHRLLIHAAGTGPQPHAVVATPLKGGYRLLVGSSLAEQERLTATLTTSIVAAIGLALVLSVGISAVLARMASTRISAITKVAGAVTEGDLSRRVAVSAGPPRDAFDNLGLMLNAMLARIESLVAEFGALTDGLAHDLRSPLARMKARIDRLQRHGDASDTQLAAIGAEADVVLGMLESSLAISRAEAGFGRDSFEKLDLAALARGMTEMYEPLADDSGVRLTITAPEPVPVRAHRALVGRALANLIDNALRHGSAGGIIEIEVITVGNDARIAVADHGPGIAAADRDRALRRFGRLDAARSSGGAGLGLSLAASVARLHRGKLGLSDNHPGLKVTIDFPG